jgi:hypothetical protein
MHMAGHERPCPGQSGPTTLVRQVFVSLPEETKRACERMSGAMWATLEAQSRSRWSNYDGLQAGENSIHHRIVSSRRCWWRLHPTHQLAPNQVLDEAYAGLAGVEAGDESEFLAAVGDEHGAVLHVELLQRLQAVG